MIDPDLPITKQKYCGDCHFFKPLSEFNKQRGTKDGLRNICRLCQRKQNALYRALHPLSPAEIEAKRQYCLEYSRKNRDRLRERRRARIAERRRIEMIRRGVMV